MLTLRAHSLISSAGCLLHDDLVAGPVLALAPAEAIVRNVGKRCGHKTITQEQINSWMVEYARQGHGVVRLKSGDPLLFGRAAEELAALREAEIPFEVVPGVSAGFSAAALAGIPLTGRISSSRVLFATRHLAAETAKGQTNGLAGIGPETTLVLYMPGRDYASIQRELMANGWPEATRCILASSLGVESQRVATCTLGGLADAESLPSPVVMILVPVQVPVPVPGQVSAE
jgi:uroporphyrin-III C-methyltransferase